MTSSSLISPVCCVMQEEDAVDVVDFPPPKSIFQLLKDSLGGQPHGLGLLAAAVQAQSTTSSILNPLVWLALAQQNSALPPGALSATSAGCMVSGVGTQMFKPAGIQMLHVPADIR